MNRRKPFSEWIITPPTQIGIYSEIYRDTRNEHVRGYFRDDYRFMVFLHKYINSLDDCKFIDYSRLLTTGLEDLELLLEKNGKLNKEEISIFERTIEQKKWLTLV